MKKLIMVFGLSLALGGVSFAKPSFVPGTKCVACHNAKIGKKTNVLPKAMDMLKKYPHQKCSECHGHTADRTKLTCTNPKFCKGKKK